MSYVIVRATARALRDGGIAAQEADSGCVKRTANLGVLPWCGDVVFGSEGPASTAFDGDLDNVALRNYSDPGADLLAGCEVQP